MVSTAIFIGLFSGLVVWVLLIIFVYPVTSYLWNPFVGHVIELKKYPGGFLDNPSYEFILYSVLPLSRKKIGYCFESYNDFELKRWLDGNRFAVRRTHLNPKFSPSEMIVDIHKPETYICR